jgi:hypothetical protein
MMIKRFQAGNVPPIPLVSSHPALREEGPMTAPMIAPLHNAPAFLSRTQHVLDPRTPWTDGKSEG